MADDESRDEHEGRLEEFLERNYRPTIRTTKEEIEKAVCLSEVAGSGHQSGVPCEWHTAAYNSRVWWLIEYLAHPEQMDALGGDDGS